MALPTALTGIVGTQLVVKSRTRDANGLPSTSPVIWTTSDPVVAIVQHRVDLIGSAVITCFSVGTATITATAGSATAEFDLTVIDPSPGAATDIEVAADHSYQQIKP